MKEYDTLMKYLYCFVAQTNNNKKIFFQTENAAIQLNIEKL